MKKRSRPKAGIGLLSMVAFLVVYFLIFQYTPMLGLILAFQNYLVSDGFLGSDWVGFQNFARLFSNQDFLVVVRNTITISVLRLGFGFFAPVLLALLLNEVRLMGARNAIQSICAIPHYISWVILGGIFLMLLSDLGPINDILAGLGMPRIGFLSDGPWFITTLVVTGIWQGIGYGAIIYLAALSGISQDYYEAAEIDGANRFQQILHVTLPALTPTMIVLFILNLGSILNAGFDQIYNMYNPSVFYVSDIIDTYVLRRIQTMEFSLGTAAGFFKSIVGLILIVAANSLARRMSGGEQGVY
jgi:putative aldouronate transport system permease protein